MSQEVEQRAILDLYAEEIINCFETHHSLLSSLSPSISFGRLEALELQYDSNWAKIARELWAYLYDRPIHNLYSLVLNLLTKCNDKFLHSRLGFNEEADKISHFPSALKSCSFVLPVMKSFIITERISNISFHHKKVLSNIPEIVEKFGENIANKTIFRRIPDFGKDGWFDLLHGVSACGQSASDLVEKIQPGFSTFYDMLKDDRNECNGRGIIHLVEKDTPFDEVFNSVHRPTDNRFEIDMRYACFSKISENLKSQWLKEQFWDGVNPRDTGIGT